MKFANNFYDKIIREVMQKYSILCYALCGPIEPRHKCRKQGAKLIMCYYEVVLLSIY